jgi:hypothetical protein
MAQVKAFLLGIAGIVGGLSIAAVNKRRDAFGAFRQGDEQTNSLSQHQTS